MFGQGSFTIDQNTTPEMLRKKREQLMAMMPQYGKARYVGEGLGQLAYGIGSGIKGRKMDKYEGERSKEATDQFSAAMAGGPMTVLGMQGFMPPDAPQQPPGPSYPFGQDAIAPTGETDPASGLSMGADAPASTGNFVVDGLVQRGMPEHIAKGFAMNFQDESGLNPTAVGDNGNAYGLAQWNGPRKAALLNYAQSNGQNAADPNVQLDFLMAELGGPESAAWGKIAGAADANQAGAAVLNHFERPAEVHRARREASYLGGSGGVGAYAPQSGQYASGGQDMAALLQAAANPWLTPEQRGVVNNLIQQQQSQSAAADERYWRQNDPMYQAQLAEAQRAAQPQAPKPIEVGGVLLDPNTYQPIFDSRTANAPEPFTLGEGQVRYGPDGKIIAEGQPKAPASPSAVQEYNFYANQEQQAGRKPLSFNEWDLQGKKAGATSVNVGDTPGDGALRKKLMEGEGTTWSNYLTAGTTSAGMTQDMELLKQVIELAPQGPISGRLAQMFPGVSDAAGVFQSVVKRVAPSLRVEGSGSQSDIEYNGFLQSLPALSNKPEANRAIATFLDAKAKINMERAQAIRAYQDGTADAPATRAKIAEIDRKSILSPELKGLLGMMDGGAAVNDDAEFLKSLGLE